MHICTTRQILKGVNISTIVENIRSIFKNNPVVFDLSCLTLVYTLAHGLMLFNRGMYWDDWVLYNMDKVLIIDMFKQAGVFWVGYLHMLVSGGGVTAYRVVSFTSYLLAAWCLYAVLKELNVDRYSRLFVVIFFAIYPVNNGRIAMINMPSAICYALFFGGFLMTALSVQRRSYWRRIAALAMLFASFSLNSLLVFYLIVIFYIMYRERPVPMSILGWLRLLPRYADYLLLPILFWIVKVTYMVPQELYAGYNQVKTDGLKHAITETFRIFDTSFLAVVDKSVGCEFFSPLFVKISSIWWFLPFACAALAVVVMFLCKKYLKIVDRQTYETLWIFLLGAFVLYLAAFPYVVVGSIPELGDWASRHQVLIPFGASVMLVYGVKLLNRHWGFLFPIYLLFMLLFIHTTVIDQISFRRDWYKQLSIMENMRKSSVILNNTSFLFRDDTRYMNFNSRIYRFYEYTGLMKEVFKNERRFGVESVTYTGSIQGNIQGYKECLTAAYNMGDFIPQEPDTLIIISHGATRLGITDVLKLMWWERSDKEKFFRAIFGIVRLEV
jgi:hypothetical protein